MLKSPVLFRTVVAGALFALLFGLSACVPGEALPSTCSDPAVTLQVVLTADQLDPTNLDVCHGQHVTIQVSSQADGALHFHGYDDQVPETDVTDGQALTVEFDASHAGQFPIELHPADGSDEIEVGTLTVHEP